MNLRLLASTADARAQSVVRGVLADAGAGLVGLQSYTDPATGWTHSRSEIDLRHAPLSAHRLHGACAALAARADLRLRIADAGKRKRVVVLVGKSEHCLRELLARSGELAIDIRCVISNHDDLRALAESHRLPFHHLPMSRADRDGAFSRVLDLYAAHRAELMVLARFMQIVPAAVCGTLAGRIINIHHSLLPAFAGARPYHQAWQRGVKWIGATAHYVNADLDQGQIIEQDTIRVDHAHSAEELTRLGAQVEARVLAAAVAAHAEDRVVLSGGRAIVFERCQGASASSMDSSGSTTGAVMSDTAISFEARPLAYRHMDLPTITHNVQVALPERDTTSDIGVDGREDRRVSSRAGSGREGLQFEWKVGQRRSDRRRRGAAGRSV